MPRLIDTHAHLDAPEYKGEKFEEVILAAKNAGVEKIISVGCDEETSLRNVELSSIYKDFIYATYGFHPHNAESFDFVRHTAQIKERVKSNSIVAIGEIGLDYYRDLSPRGVQKEVFLKQLAVAREADFPVIIHIRDAFEDFKKFTDGIDFKGVIHCYSGDAEFAKWAVDRGFYISFTASITYPLKAVYKMAGKTSRSVYEVIRNYEGFDSPVPASMLDLFSCVPLERIMIETDCPYLSPQNLRGRLNEPANVSAAAEVIAAIKKTGYEEFCDIAFANAKRFFSI